MGPRALRASRLAKLRYYRNQRLQLQVNAARGLIHRKRWQLRALVGLAVLVIAAIGAAAALVVHQVFG